MKSACERCGAAVRDADLDVFICSYECTWCRSCAEGELDMTCPNCGGMLRPRPPRGAPTSDSSGDAAIHP